MLVTYVAVLISRQRDGPWSLKMCEWGEDSPMTFNTWQARTGETKLRTERGGLS